VKAGTDAHRFGFFEDNLYSQLRLMPDTPNTPARLSVTYRRLRRLTDVSMGGVTALALASVAALVVCINGDLYFHDSYHHFDPVSRDIDLFTGGGAVGLAFALSGLRLRLFKTLACVVALCFFVVVFEALLIYQLKETGDTSRLNSRPIVPWLTILLAVFGGSVTWCLQKAHLLSSVPSIPEPQLQWLWTSSNDGNIVSAARHLRAKSRRTVGLGIVAVICAGLILFPAWVWVFGLGAPQLTRTLYAFRHPAPTWPEIKHIIATEAFFTFDSVPEERVIPSARLREDLHIIFVSFITERLRDDYGIDARDEDENLLITVQDVIDYAKSPQKFRTNSDAWILKDN
jgi:hypothetical protein